MQRSAMLAGVRIKSGTVMGDERALSPKGSAALPKKPLAIYRHPRYGQQGREAK